VSRRWLEPADERAGLRTRHPRARHSEAERGDDQHRPPQAAAELAAHELRVPLRPAEHRRVVGEVVLRRDERDLDRVAAPLGRLQDAEELELDGLRRPVGEGRVEQLGLEVVARRVAVREHAAGSGERDEHGDGGEQVPSQ
jgi:hypothetical protein